MFQLPTIQAAFPKGSERPENAMLWRFQRRAGGSPGPIAKPFGRGPQAAKPPAAMKAVKLFSSDRRHVRRLFLHTKSRLPGETWHGEAVSVR